MAQLFLLILALMPATPQTWGYAVKPSAYPYSVTTILADAPEGSAVVWELPSTIQRSFSIDYRQVNLWVAGTDKDCSPVHYWSGRFDASYLVYQAGRPVRRVRFFLVVK